MRLRFLLQPGWLALTLVVLSFAIACFALLAPWQFGRHAERSATNDAITRASSAEPVPLADLLPGDTAPGPDTEWRTVRVTGTYLAGDEVVARLRTVLGEPAFEVLTPLRTSDGDVLLVDRGFVRPVQGDQGTRVPDYAAPPRGTVEVTARVRVDERDPLARQPSAGADGRRQMYAVDSRAVAKTTGLDIRPGYLQLTGGSPGVLGALPLPELDAGPFLSYALQWITFGVMALLAWLYFTWREARPGGALTTAPRRLGPAVHGRPVTLVRSQARSRIPRRERRPSVAQQVAEEEARERTDSAAGAG